MEENEARHEQRHSQLMEELQYNRRCLLEVREWGQLTPPDNTLVQQLQLRDKRLLANKEQEITALQTRFEIASAEINDKTTAVARAMHADAERNAAKEALNKSRKDAESAFDQQARQHTSQLAIKDRLLSEKDRRIAEKERRLAEKKRRVEELESTVELLSDDLRVARAQSGAVLPKLLMKESSHARKHAKIAFHPQINSRPRPRVNWPNRCSSRPRHTTRRAPAATREILNCGDFIVI